MVAAGVWSAPGRVNLIGEHTDYCGGFVLPIAIGLRTSVAASVRHDREVRVHSRQQGSPEPYVFGAIGALRAHGVDVPGLDLVVDGRVPIGAGLSSSAALTCATVLAGSSLAAAELSLLELALIAHRAEHDFVGVPCGVMDQMAAMCSTEGHALFLNTRSLVAEQVPFRPADSGLALLVIDTGVRHSLADSGYAERRRAVEHAAQRLGVTALRDVTVSGLDDAERRLDDAVLFHRVRHVVTENQRVLDTVALLRAQRLPSIGPLLTASHSSLRDDYDVSVPALDIAVDAALAAGALGARMTGGGFGGSVIALVPADSVAAVTAATIAAAADAGQPRPAVMAVDASAGARRDSP